MTDKEQKKVLTDILKHLRFQDMDTAKHVIHKCMTYNCSQVSDFVPFNYLMCCIGLKAVEYGSHWGWRNLGWDILSNKYGAAASYNPKTKKTIIKIFMPPLVKIESN